MEATKITKQTIAEQATTMLEELAVKRLVKKAAKAVQAGTHEWRRDPQVEGVIGLIRVGTNRADIVIYMTATNGAGDFEVSNEWELS